MWCIRFVGLSEQWIFCNKYLAGRCAIRGSHIGEAAILHAVCSRGAGWPEIYLTNSVKPVDSRGRVHDNSAFTRRGSRVAKGGRL